MRMHLIIASLPKYNPGMIAANNAAVELLTGEGIDLRVFELYARYSAPDAPDSQSYLGSLDEMFTADRIVFWGDWLHMQFYHEELHRASLSSKSGDRVVSIAEIQRHLFLDTLPHHRLSDVAILGTTLALDSPVARAQPEYLSKIRTLYGGAGLVLVRDTFSAGIVQSWRLRPDRCTGMDGAFFYRPRLQLGPGSHRGPMGFFFGRSSRFQRMLGQSLVASIGQAAGLKQQWIPWYASTREGTASTHVSAAVLTDLARGAAKRASPSSLRPVGKRQILLDGLIDRIRSCSWIVTDTYHLAVVAWAQGVPCTLVGSGLGFDAGDVNAGPSSSGIDKRMALYLTMDAAPLYCTFQEISSRKGRRDVAERQAAHMATSELFPAAVLEGVELRRSAFRRDVATWLDS